MTNKTTNLKKPVSTTLNDNHRILAQGRYINNNTWQTGLNNNDLIIGVSGAGKTRGYVITQYPPFQRKHGHRRHKKYPFPKAVSTSEKGGL